MIHLGISQQHKIILRARASLTFLAGMELFLFVFFVPIIVLRVELVHSVCWSRGRMRRKEAWERGGKNEALLSALRAPRTRHAFSLLAVAVTPSGSSSRSSPADPLDLHFVMRLLRVSPTDLFCLGR